MEIHKPKAAHSWREFLVEIGTIICGIVIALLLEQAVEAIHRDREVREAREALATEIRGDAERLKLIVEADACLERQLDVYASWARGGAKPPAYRTFQPQLWHATWDTVKSGAVTNMPLRERIALAAFYDQLDSVKKNQETVLEKNALVSSLDELSVLNEDQRISLLKALALDRRAVQVESATSARLVDVADTVVETRPSVQLPPVLRPGVDWVCGRSAADPFATPR